jgi:hypothetical protein
MSELLARGLTVASQAAWFFSCLPGWFRFRQACANPRAVQTRILLEILRANQDTQFGRRLGFARMTTSEDYRQVPVSDPEDYEEALARIRTGQDAVLTAEPVTLLHPTSGTTTATKLIPYTAGLQGQFQSALEPWISDLYLRNPGLWTSTQYWSISPQSTIPLEHPSRVPIGFADDADYLGRARRGLSRHTFAVPPVLRNVHHPDTWEYLTLLFLLADPHLGLISVWHPSFLVLLLNAAGRHWSDIVNDLALGRIRNDLSLPGDIRGALRLPLRPNPRRADKLRSLDPNQPDWPTTAWPKLRVISCWTDASAGPWRSRLQARFPGVNVQAKGLMATEGVVSIPFGGKDTRPLAVRSHYYEFIEPSTGIVKSAWELQAGQVYSVLLTTAGGLYRYRLHDRVQVSGFFRKTPCFTFVGRDNSVSDLVGEKLSEVHVADAVATAAQECRCRLPFAVLAPTPASPASPHYTLWAQPEGADLDVAALASAMERELCRNYHYAHARQTGQLLPVQVSVVPGDAERRYRDHLARNGRRLGDVKIGALSCEPGLERLFR